MKSYTLQEKESNYIHQKKSFEIELEREGERKRASLSEYIQGYSLSHICKSVIDPIPTTIRDLQQCLGVAERGAAVTGIR